MIKKDDVAQVPGPGTYDEYKSYKQSKMQVPSFRIGTGPRDGFNIRGSVS